VLTIGSMMKDIEYFNSKLGKIDGFGDLASRLTDLASEKGIAQPSTETGTSESPEEQCEETKPAET
jgi:hypothetical protein